MFYYIYKITNLVNNKIYIGAHQTGNLDDGYMGSGKLIKAAIEKYGIENFKKEILSMHETSVQMFETEKLIVTEEFVNREDTYNLKIGGYGGWDHITYQPFSDPKIQNILSIKGNAALVEKRKDPVWAECFSHTMKISRTKDNRKPFAGKTHSAQTKKRLSESAKMRLADPTKNSQYGTIWITDGTQNRKIQNTDSIPDGWYRGRIKPKP